MLDRLLGRATLKDEIETLREELATCEKERERLQEQLEATDQRRKDAFRDHQLAQERVHTLEDRIEQLEDDLSRERDEQSVDFRGRSTLTYHDIEPLLDLLESVRTQPEGAYTAVLDGGTLPEPVQEQFVDRRALLERSRPCICCFDSYGIVELALQPPIRPDFFANWADRFTLEREWFVPTTPHTFILIRRDRFAIGTYRDGELTDVSGFTSDVMSRHSKGGFSQDRFARRRQHQIREHRKKCRNRIQEHDPSLPRIVTGSEEMLDALEVESHATATVDASGPPREAIERAFEQFWVTTVHRL